MTFNNNIYVFSTKRQIELEQLICNTFGREYLQSDDFCSDLSLFFEDGSHIIFKNAIIFGGKDCHYVCTEHCGYHVYFRDTIVEWVTLCQK